jgi:hypothetical protein
VGEAYERENRAGRARAVPAPPGPGIRERPGLRITLLSVATAILMFGAMVAGICCYLTLNHA